MSSPNEKTAHKERSLHFAAEDLHPAARLVAVKAVYRPIARRLERQLGNLRAALCALQIYLVHLSLCTAAATHAASAAHGAGSATVAKTITAVHRPVRRRLERKLGNLFSALRALQIDCEHLSRLIHML
jgi:hypothetical protein